MKKRPVLKLLERLDSVRKVNPDSWLACCPSHQDRTPSLSIRELDDGRLLIHCFGGCDAGDIMAAVGLSVSDLFPVDNRTHHRPGAPDWFLKRIEAAKQHEALVLEIYQGDQSSGRKLTDTDHQRARLAAERVRKMDDLLQEARRHAGP